MLQKDGSDSSAPGELQAMREEDRRPARRRRQSPSGRDETPLASCVKKGDGPAILPGMVTRLGPATMIQVSN